MRLSMMLFSLLYGFVITVPSKYQMKPPVEHAGMKVSWGFYEDKIRFELDSPEKGWLAVGFNPKPGLSNTHFVMGAVQDNHSHVEDRFILAPGNHQSIAGLGGEALLEEVEIKECWFGTTLSFSLPIEPNSQYHYALKPGIKLHLLIAYSLEDDFEHHSVMRKSIEIIL